MNKKALLIIDVQYDFLYANNGEINDDLLKIYNFLRGEQKNISSQYQYIVKIIDNLELIYTENTKLNNFALVNEFDHQGIASTINGLLVNEDDYFTEREEDFLKEHYLDILTNVIYKEYGYFRNFMDNIVDTESEIYLLDLLVNIIPYMIKDNISDSSKITIKLLDKMKLSKKQYIEYQDLFIDGEHIDTYSFSLPELLIKEISKNLPNKNIHIDLIGGGINACLKEIHILLKGLEYNNINILHDLTY